MHVLPNNASVDYYVKSIKLTNIISNLIFVMVLISGERSPQIQDCLDKLENSKGIPNNISLWKARKLLKD